MIFFKSPNIVLITNKMENWSNSLEELLAKYADEAQCRQSLHRKSYYHFKKILNFFQLPIIIFSAASGSLQFLSKSFNALENYIITGTASLSIIVSLLSAVMSFLKIGENMTKNSISLGEWQNFYNTLSHQLALSREERQEPEKFIEWVKTTYDRLQEISPVVSQKIITSTKKKIRKNGNEEFRVPNYLNGVCHTKIYHEPDDEFEDNSV